MNTNKKLCIILILIFFIIGIMFFFGKVAAKKQIITELDDDLIARQTIIDKKIDAYTGSARYSLSNPMIIINPYEISPLTALIIFSTNEETSLTISINDNYSYSMEKSKSHCIPIYGLLANFNNVVTITTEKGTTGEYVIQTELDKEIPTTLDVETENKLLKNGEYYFTSSSTSSLLYSAFDGMGNLVWHLEMPSQGEIKELDNGNFLVSVEEYITDGISSFTGIYEMNYLGKIIKRYDTEYLYHHDMMPLSDNTIMLLGTTLKDTQDSLATIYRISRDSGETLDSINIHEIFTNIDPDFDKKVTLNHGFGLNSIDYKESTKELLISSRTMNFIASINYETKKLNWIFTNPEDFPDTFSGYFLNKTSLVSWPYGQHEAKFLPNGNISLYNNNFDEKNSKEDKLSNYNENIASATILNVNANTKTVSRVFNYNEPNNKFSYAFGGFKVYDNTKLMNFSYLYTDDAYNKNASIYELSGNTYSRIIEQNYDGTQIFNATINDRLYRVDKITLPSEYKNYEVIAYKYFNASKNDTFIVDANKLATAKKYDSILNVYSNSIECTLANDAYNELYIIFKGKDIVALPYHKTKLYYHLDPGTYEVYIYLDGNFYNQNIEIKTT